MHDWSGRCRPLRDQCWRLAGHEVRQPRQIALLGQASSLVGRDWVARSPRRPSRHGRRALWLLLLLPVIQAVAGTLFVG